MIEKKETHPAQQRAVAILAIVCVICVILLVNPIGFIGGTRDDGRYLEAVRCWAQSGPCLPKNHWQGRWPVFVPTAFLTWALGESRTVVAIWPLVCATSALVFFAEIGRRLTDWATGTLAAILLALTPVFSFQLLRPNADTAELAAVLAAIFIVMMWRARQMIQLALAAGLLFGLAFQIRETSLVAAGLTILALYVYGPRPRISHVAIAVGGFLIPLIIEFGVFQTFAGDMLYRRELSLTHTQIPSSELPLWVDRTQSPLFNTEFIAHWRRALDIHVHWLVDGPLNLVLDVSSGLSLLFAPVLLIVARGWIAAQVRSQAWSMLGWSAVHIAIVTYALAIDPKPRTMLIPLALSTLSLALIITNLFSRERRALAIVIGTMIGGAGFFMTSSSLRMGWADDQAQAWANEFPGKIEVDEQTRVMMPLTPAVQAMPTIESDRSYLMMMRDIPCRSWLRSSGLDRKGLSLIGEIRLSLVPARLKTMPSLCLFRYSRPIESHVVGFALRGPVLAD